MVDNGSQRRTILIVHNVNQKTPTGTTNMAVKTEAIHIRITESEKELLNELAVDRDVPVAQIVREAVREKIAAIKESTATSTTATATT